MQVVVCAIAKNEHLYINDWCHWYLNIGFDRIYLFDNDDKTSPFIGDFIDADIRNKVTIIDVRGKHVKKLQIKKYKYFYKKYHKTFDWCFFPDIDEFLAGIPNIKAFLSQPKFRTIHSIRVKWRLIGDDNLITRDMSKPVYECLHICVEDTEHLPGYNSVEIFYHKNQGKYLLRGKLKHRVTIQSEHYAGKGKKEKWLKSVLPSGIPCKSEIIIEESYVNEKIYLNHYMTKTLSEFVNQKLGRTDAIFKDRELKLSYYWRINKMTPEKINWLYENNYITLQELNWAYGAISAQG